MNIPNASGKPDYANYNQLDNAVLCNEDAPGDAQKSITAWRKVYTVADAQGVLTVNKHTGDGYEAVGRDFYQPDFRVRAILVTRTDYTEATVTYDVPYSANIDTIFVTGIPQPAHLTKVYSSDGHGSNYTRIHLLG